MSLGQIHSRPITQVEIEQEITRLTDRLEAATEELSAALHKAARSEADYKLAYYRRMLDPEVRSLRSQELRTALAHTATESEFVNRLSTQAAVDALTEECRSLRAILSAKPTLSSNLRVLT